MSERPARQPRATRTVRRRGPLPSVVLLAALLCAAPGAAAGQAAPVAVAEAQRSAIVDPLRLSGTVVSPRVARVSGDVAGLVAGMEVELGDRVGAGAPLVRLDRELGRLDLDAAAAETREARARLADARRRLEDGKRLAADDTLPQNEVEVRRLAVRRAQARLDRLEIAEARQRERLARHVIRAPFAGVVAERLAEAGEWVEPGAAVVELVATGRLLVEVPVPQRYFGAVTEETTARLRFEAAPERGVPAGVAARVPVSDPTARTFRLRLRPEAQGLALTPGMSARVTLRLETGEQGITVPRDALVRYPDGRTTVWVIEPGDPPTVAERPIAVGRSFDGRIAVAEGLEAGTRVVIRGNEALTPGQRVRLADGPG